MSSLSSSWELGCSRGDTVGSVTLAPCRPLVVCCHASSPSVQLCRGCVPVIKSGQASVQGLLRQKASCVLDHCLDARFGCYECPQVCWSRDVHLIANFHTSETKSRNCVARAVTIALSSGQRTGDNTQPSLERFSTRQASPPAKTPSRCRRNRSSGDAKTRNPDGSSTPKLLTVDLATTTTQKTQPYQTTTMTPPPSPVNRSNLCSHQASKLTLSSTFSSRSTGCLLTNRRCFPAQTILRNAEVQQTEVRSPLARRRRHSPTCRHTVHSFPFSFWTWLTDGPKGKTTTSTSSTFSLWQPQFTSRLN